MTIVKQAIKHTILLLMLPLAAMAGTIVWAFDKNNKRSWRQHVQDHWEEVEL